MDAQDFDLRGTFGLLRRQLFILGLSLLLALAGAALLLLSVKPVYTAHALVLVGSGNHDQLLSGTASPSALPESPRVDSDAELATSDANLLNVAAALDLAADPEFAADPGWRSGIFAALHLGGPPATTPEADTETLSHLRDAIAAERRGETLVIDISARSQRPEFAARLANAAAGALVEAQRQGKIAAIDADRAAVDARLADANAGLVRAEQAIDTFVATNVERVGTEPGRENILETRRQLDDDIADQHAQQARADAAATALGRADWPAIAASLNAEAVATLDQQRQTLTRQLAALPPDAAQAAELRAELQRVEVGLGDAARRSIALLRQQIAASDAQQAALRTTLRAAVTAADLPVADAATLFALQQGALNARAQYQSLIAREQDLVAAAGLQVADLSLMSPALPPSAATWPNWRLTLLLAAIAGLALGVLLAFARENFIGGFTSEEQIRSVLRLPVVAALPWHRPGKGADPESFTLANLLVTDPLSDFAESVRRIQLGIDHALQRHPRAPATRPRLRARW